jgi:hypothetical protein
MLVLLLFLDLLVSLPKRLSGLPLGLAREHADQFPVEMVLGLGMHHAFGRDDLGSLPAGRSRAPSPWP